MIIKKKGFIATIKDFFEGPEKKPVDPAVFNDPLALKTQWEPLQAGGANAKTYRLKSSGGYYLEFRPTFTTFIYPIVGTIFGLVFIAIGCAAGFEWFNNATYEGASPQVFGIMFCVFGGTAIFQAIRAYYQACLPLVFDKQEGYYRAGQKITHWWDPIGEEDLLPLSDIYAIQILSEYVKAKIPFNSYEINLILKDGSRKAVIDHHGKRTIKDDAYALGRFLGVPVWEAI
jgi:hypothetical protein